MVYNFSLDIAALILNIVLLLLAIFRNNYPSKTSNTFKVMLFMHLTATIMDIISVYAISNPSSYPMAFNYGINIAYYLFHNICTLLYVIYGMEQEKIDVLKGHTRTVLTIITVAVFVIICTTPLTKIVFYYDDNLVYRHGPFLYLLYALALFAVLYVLILKFKNREKNSTYQLYVNVIYFVLLICSFVYHTIFPKYLIELFAIDLGFLLMYIAQENTSTFLYKGIAIYNRRGFDEELYVKTENGKIFDIIVFTPENAEEYIALKNNQEIFTIEKQMIQRLNSNETLKDSFYMLSDLCFAVFSQGNEKYYIDIINKLFSKPITINDKENTYRMSYSLMRYPAVVKDYSEATQVVDDLIYRVRNYLSPGVLIADRRAIKKSDDKVSIRTIKKALENNGFVVNYEPIVSLSNGYTYHTEAIISIKDENKTIDERSIYEIAEKNGALFETIEGILLTIYRFIKGEKLNELGISGVVVKLPIRCMLNRDFPERLREITENSGISPEYICFEINDFEDYQGKNIIKENVDMLINKGFMVTLGDFGRGKIDMSLLSSTPFKAVKVSNEVLNSIDDYSKSKIILKNMLKMIKELGIGAACEGVNSQNQADLVNCSYCDYAQGSYYGKPLSEEEFIIYLKKQLGIILEDISNK